jgi:hypothetical protein
VIEAGFISLSVSCIDFLLSALKTVDKPVSFNGKKTSRFFFSPRFVFMSKE